MKNLTPEMIEKAKAVKSAEELLALAKENNVEMTADEAATYFAQLNPKSGEVNDDDLDSVAGGACGTRSDAKSTAANLACPNCGAIGQFTHNSSYVDGHWWTCRACSVECWTEDAESNSIMHTKGHFN